MEATERKTVVYIEDEPELIDLLRLILREDKINLRAALSGREGLDLVRQLKPDLVLLDLMLPDIEGWEIFRELQAAEALCDIPVIVVTVRTEGLIEGVWPQVKQLAGYLVKPFTVHDMRAAVEHVLGMSLA